LYVVGGVVCDESVCVVDGVMAEVVLLTEPPSARYPSSVAASSTGGAVGSTGRKVEMADVADESDSSEVSEVVIVSGMAAAGRKVERAADAEDPAASDVADSATGSESAGVDVGKSSVGIVLSALEVGCNVDDLEDVASAVSAVASVSVGISSDSPVVVLATLLLLPADLLAPTGTLLQVSGTTALLLSGTQHFLHNPSFDANRSWQPFAFHRSRNVAIGSNLCETRAFDPEFCWDKDGKAAKECRRRNGASRMLRRDVGDIEVEQES
jgi:hypothetical protein